LARTYDAPDFGDLFHRKGGGDLERVLPAARAANAGDDALPDEITVELGDSCEHMEEQPPRRGYARE